MVLGGPIGVYETDRYPFIQDELARVRERLAARGTFEPMRRSSLSRFIVVGATRQDSDEQLDALLHSLNQRRIDLAARNGLPPAEPFPIPVHSGDVRADVGAVNVPGSPIPSRPHCEPLALLSQGMLKGSQLTEFINRSVDIMKSSNHQA